VAVNSAGKVFVTGSVAHLGTSGDYITIAYKAATGAKLWVRRYNGPGNLPVDAATPVAVSPATDKVFVTGTSAGLAENDFATVAYRG
jgi:hypothetical protein